MYICITPEIPVHVQVTKSTCSLLQILRTRLVRCIRVVVVLPTKDLAFQVFNVFKQYSIGTDLKVICLGNATLDKERNKLIASGELTPISPYLLVSKSTKKKVTPCSRWVKRLPKFGRHYRYYSRPISGAFEIYRGILARPSPLPYHRRSGSRHGVHPEQLALFVACQNSSILQNHSFLHLIHHHKGAIPSAKVTVLGYSLARPRETATVGTLPADSVHFGGLVRGIRR